MRNDGSLYNSKLKYNIIALIPILVLSLISIILTLNNNRSYLTIYMFSMPYNTFLLPILVIYINVFKYNLIKNKHIDLLITLAVPALGQLVQFLCLYVFVNAKFAPGKQINDDISFYFFFIIPTTICFIISIIGFILGEVTYKFFNRKK